MVTKASLVADLFVEVGEIAVRRPCSNLSSIRLGRLNRPRRPMRRRVARVLATGQDQKPLIARPADLEGASAKATAKLGTMSCGIQP